jgi:hypothetical protein
VHTLVPIVLVGRGWLDEIGHDAGLDPPDAELGEPSQVGDIEQIVQHPVGSTVGGVLAAGRAETGLARKRLDPHLVAVGIYVDSARRGSPRSGSGSICCGVETG